MCGSPVPKEQRQALQADEQIWVGRLSWLVAMIAFLPVLGALVAGPGVWLAVFWIVVLSVAGVYLHIGASLRERKQQMERWKRGSHALSMKWLSIAPGWPRITVRAVWIAFFFCGGLFAVVRQMMLTRRQEEAYALLAIAGIHLCIVLGSVLAVLALGTPDFTQGRNRSPTWLGALGGGLGGVTSVTLTCIGVLTYEMSYAPMRLPPLDILIQQVLLGAFCLGMWGAFVGGPIGYALVAWTRHQNYKRILKEKWLSEYVGDKGIEFVGEVEPSMPEPGIEYVNRNDEEESEPNEEPAASEQREPNIVAKQPDSATDEETDGIRFVD